MASSKEYDKKEAERKKPRLHQGRFQPINPKKYKGDHTNIIFRSGWERRVMMWLDTDPRILKWSSEEVIIPYVSPVDGRRHRYFVDFYVETTDRTMLLEVKPLAQTKEPKKPSRRTKRYLTEVMTYGVNQAKWKAATDYCADRGWEFKVITEVELFNKKQSK